MKIETFKTPSIKTGRGCLQAALRSLKPGQAIRIKTAAEWRSAAAKLNLIGREIGASFSSINDGPDVLVYLNSNKQRAKRAKL